MESVKPPTWRKSSYSGTNGGGCLEAGAARPGEVLVRDSKDRMGAVLAVPADAWRRFTGTLK